MIESLGPYGLQLGFFFKKSGHFREILSGFCDKLI